MVPRRVRFDELEFKMVAALECGAPASKWLAAQATQIRMKWGGEAA